MTLLTNNEITAIKQRCNQLSSKNWKVYKITLGNVSFYDVITHGDFARPHTKQECEFIAHARNDIPKMLQHIDSLQKLLLQYKDTLEELGYLNEKEIV